MTLNILHLSLFGFICNMNNSSTYSTIYEVQLVCCQHSHYCGTNHYFMEL